jgi:hypothetical protein
MSRCRSRVSTAALRHAKRSNVRMAAAAIRRAEAMSSREEIAGAVAFYRRGNPDLGEFDEAEILKTFGQVPEDFRDI